MTTFIYWIKNFFHKDVTSLKVDSGTREDFKSIAKKMKISEGELLSLLINEFVTQYKSS